MKTCPKCGGNYQNDQVECQKCGIIFEKYEALKKRQMAKKQPMMLKCDVCDHSISKNADFCPNCGDPNKTQKVTDSSTKNSIESSPNSTSEKLIKCENCGALHQKTANKCPKCNLPNKKANYLSTSQVLLSLIMVFGVFFYSILVYV